MDTYRWTRQPGIWPTDRVRLILSRLSRIRLIRSEDHSENGQFLDRGIAEGMLITALHCRDQPISSAQDSSTLDKDPPSCFSIHYSHTDLLPAHLVIIIIIRKSQPVSGATQPSLWSKVLWWRPCLLILIHLRSEHRKTCTKAVLDVCGLFLWPSRAQVDEPALRNYPADFVHLPTLSIYGPKLPIMRGR